MRPNQTYDTFMKIQTREGQIKGNHRNNRFLQGFNHQHKINFIQNGLSHFYHN